MDLFDFFRDWDLEQQCHFEQDRSALKRKEWERRNQEVQQDEDLFASGFNLFGEPYKTNRGDALANRVQNTLGNYDEMKDLLTNHSNQSHLVGIPKNTVPQTPVEKNDQNFFPEQRNRVAQCHQNNTHSTSTMPPPSTIASTSSLMHGHESSTRKSRMDWPHGSHTSSCTQPNQPSTQSARSKHNLSHDPSQIRFEDLYNCQNDQHKLGIVDEPVPATSSTHTRRHNHSKLLSGEQIYKDNTHSKSPIELEFPVHDSVSPLPSTSLLLANNGISSQNFPPGIHSKISTIQQKPTAYVRPMDGQDQISNDSPELKPPTEMEDGYNNQPLGAVLEGKVNTPVIKNKLPKLTIPQANEVSLPNDPSCVEEILREMTHTWPPPLTAIHTPCKAEPKFSIPTKDSQHLTSGYSIQKRCDVPNKTAAKSIPQKSMLEDDLKLSSDEEDSEQATEKTKPRNIPVNGLPLPNVHSANIVNSSGGSGSSSESESSSESDSDSESSSSDSECNEGTRNATPEPEPPSKNKWQLDKWLNKVNSHNKTIINNQIEVHSDNTAESQNNQQVVEETKRELNSIVPQSDSKERELRSPVREKVKPRASQKPAEAKTLKQKSPAHNEQVPPRSLAKKQPKKVERSSSAEDCNWNKPNPTSSTPKEKELREIQEQPKSRAKNPVAKTAPRKEQRTSMGNASEKKRARGATKIVPKSREFVETDSASDSNTDQEEVLQSKISTTCGGLPNPIKTKDCNNITNILSVSSITSHNSNLSLDQTHNDLEEQFSPLPVVQNELLSPLRDYEELKSLWVKIDLSLLSRIPGQETFQTVSVKDEGRDTGFKHKHQTSATTPEKCFTKSRRKHKQSDSFETQNESKKQRLETNTAQCLLPPCISPIPNNRITSTKEMKKTNKKREEKFFPPLLSPLADEPPPRRHSSDSISFNLESSVTTSVVATTTSTRHKKNGSTKGICEEDHNMPPSSSLENIHLVPTWPTIPTLTNGNTDPRRIKLTFDETLHNADYYMQDAKRLKHKADALMDKFGKAVNYADAALSFIECGNAMERDPLEAKSPYTMYSETVELIRYAMRLKNFTSSSASEGEKKLAVLCYRCLSLLYLRMFKLKKEHAMKYSRSLMEYFKNSSKSSQAPSPWGGNGKNTETPSPMPLSPSPLSSSGNSSGSTVSSSTGTVSIPQRIHHMAASHVNITNNVLRSYEHWDMADKLTKENKEFFQDLDTVMEPLTQHSTMTYLVRYVRQGLHWLRIESQLL
ncbi:AF4/FMR2 family member 2 [Pelobates fuscus]|uniref:AF4/FMR2 family member 2 n=1 Tax=Pelobates fuscus TaxID=191477 RepID=UPI002FE458FD